MVALAVALGGAVGSVARYGLGVLAGNPSWPWATLAINVFGSLCAGFLAEWSTARLPPAVSTAVIVGLLGGFTTFSAFSVQVIALTQEGRLAAAVSYVTASVLLGLGAALLGITLGTRLLS
ncbi:MAG TPA: CrcB family protein [Nocardioidaceae bacterium]|nr:CrcB family protein [Nocardioidaceae bacterium]